MIIIRVMDDVLSNSMSSKLCSVKKYLNSKDLPFTSEKIKITPINMPHHWDMCYIIDIDSNDLIKQLKKHFKVWKTLEVFQISKWNTKEVTERFHKECEKDYSNMLFGK
jgi:hypothetical protein